MADCTHKGDQRYMSAFRRATLAPLVVSGAFAVVMNACTPPASIGGGPLPTAAPFATPTAPGATPTPTGATATPTPASTPLGAITVNPTSLAFIGTGAALALPFIASETGYTGVYTESDTCSGIATVTAGAAGHYTITPSGAGTCSVTIADTFAQKASVAVSVTVTGGVIQ